MTSLLARLGHQESRRAVQIIWSNGKRKRGAWVCAGCKDRRALRQRRHYSDDSLRATGQFWSLDRNVDQENTGQENAEATTQSGLDATESRETEAQLKAFGIPPEESVKRRARAKTSSFFNQREPLARSAPLSPEQEQLALWEQFEQVEGDENVAGQASKSDRFDDSPGLSMPEGELLNLNYKALFAGALARKEADLTIRCLFSAFRAGDIDFIRSIPQSTFTEVIRVLHPQNFVAKLGTAHIELSSALVESMGIAPMRETAYEYSLVLRRICKMRRDAGIGLTLEDYRLLLRAARDLGSPGHMAWSLWAGLEDDGIVPDTKCYNYYMSSIVWRGMHSSGCRQKVRVIPFHILARSGQLNLSPFTKNRFKNYRVGAGGVREKTMGAFNRMLSRGGLADEESFRILITACAREGDVSTIKILLKKVWGIDVTGIMDGRPEEEIMPKQFPVSSSLRPTANLLFTIAHSFGINNDIPTALRVVDFVARHFQLEIAEETWAQLFEWTFVLSIRRSNKLEGHEKGIDTGNLPSRSPQTLWETMTGAPYFIQPTLGMYNLLIKNLERHHAIESLVKNLREAFTLMAEHRQRTLQSLAHLRDLLKRERAGEDLHHQSIEHARQDWDYNELLRKRNYFWAKRWMRLILGAYTHVSREDHHFEFSAELLPGLLWDHRYHCPRTIRYETPTGLIEFELRQEDEQEWRRLRREGHSKTEREGIDDSRRYVGNEWTVTRPERRLAIQMDRQRRRTAGLAKNRSAEEELPEQVNVSALQCS